MKAIQYALLQALRDGAFHSSRELCGDLACSRTTLWTEVRSLQEMGIAIQAIRGRGYRLPQPWTPYDVAALQGALDPGLAGLELVTSTGSTNQDLLARCDRPNGLVRLAEWQTGGRGRLGRKWQGTLGGSVLMSMCWRFAGGANGLAGLSLVIGVAMVRALRSLGVTDAGLKWPNDLLRPMGKLGGILLEVQGEVAGPCDVVIGMGLNVRLGREARALDQAAADLGEFPHIRRDAVVVAVCNTLASMLPGFDRHGLSPWREEWQQYHLYQGCEVRLLPAVGSPTTGVVRGITDQGALLLEGKEGLRHYYSGDVSLRRVTHESVD